MARFANDGDLEFIKNIWRVCFGDTEEYISWYFKNVYLPENTVVAERGGVPVSAMQLLPFTIRLGETELNGRYVAGVSTLPEYRMQGLTRELFDFGILAMRDMGCKISVLAAAVKGMYEKFGYAMLSTPKAYLADSLCQAAERELDGIIDELCRIYRAEMTGRGAYAVRTRKDWERIAADIIEVSNGRIILGQDGYILAYPKDGGYFIPEVFGSLPVGVKEAENMPVMARIIDTEAARRLCPGLNKTEDIAEMTARLFEMYEPIYICFPQ